LKKTDEAVTLAQNLSHPYSLVWALTYAAKVHQFRRESGAAQEQAGAAIALSTEQGFTVWGPFANVTRGWALAEQGKEEGISQIRQGAGAYRASGSGIHWSYHLGVLAEAYGKCRQAEEGLGVLSEALALIAGKTGDPFYEAELYRLKGEMMLQQPRVLGIPSSVENEAEQCFLKAIDIARDQQAKSLELRAAASLARLLARQGRRDEAQALLAEIYGWFTEGFDTADLREAKALLEQLNS
jgi:predicted ATPase